VIDSGSGDRASAISGRRPSRQHCQEAPQERGAITRLRPAIPRDVPAQHPPVRGRNPHHHEIGRRCLVDHDPGAGFGRLPGHRIGPVLWCGDGSHVYPFLILLGCREMTTYETRPEGIYAIPDNTSGWNDTGPGSRVGRPGILLRDLSEEIKGQPAFLCVRNRDKPCSTGAMKHAFPVALLVFLLIAFRLVSATWSGLMPGFEPLSAVFLCTAALVGLRWLWIPATAWLLSYPLSNAIQGHGWDWQMAVALAGFAAVVLVGRGLRGRTNLPVLLGGAAAAAVVFYLVTGLASWLLLPDYAKTATGLVQALWTGAPHHALPTWVFLRGALLANLLFTALFFLGQRQWAAAPEEELAAVRVRR